MTITLPDHLTDSKSVATTRVTPILLTEHLRADDDQGTFEGWACKYNVKDSYGTTFYPGCFTALDSLDGVRFPFLKMHNNTDVLGTFTAEESDEGLYIVGRYDDTQAGREARIQALSGSAPGLSVGFQWIQDPADDDPYAIKIARLIETSQITLGLQAVPGAELTGVRADEAATTAEDLQRVVDAAAEAALFNLRTA